MASYLVGEHDFKSFCSTKTVAETTVRTIYDIRVEKSGELICVRVTGSGFLYNMVRIIVGTLMEAGRGVLHLTDDRHFKSLAIASMQVRRFRHAGLRLSDMSICK